MEPVRDACVRLDRRAMCDRCQRVLRRRAYAQVADPARLDERQGRCERGRRGDVRDLPAGQLSMPWPAADSAPAGEVEGDRRVAALSQCRRIASGHLLLDREPRSSHQHTRLALGQTADPAVGTSDDRRATATEQDRESINALACHARQVRTEPATSGGSNLAVSRSCRRRSAGRRPVWRRSSRRKWPTFE